MRRFIASAFFALLAVACSLLPAIAENRVTWYYGEQPSDQKLNLEARNLRLGLGTDRANLFGSSSGFFNLTISPATGLYITVGPGGASGLGALYQQIPDDSAAQGGGPIDPASQLAADPTTILGQALVSAASPNIGPLSVPSTSGYSTISLIECQITTVDTTSLTTKFITQIGTPASVAVNRDRDDVLSCQAKAGTAAASPSVPSTDSGWVAIGYVTVPQGTTTITSGMVTMLTPISPALDPSRYPLASPSPGDILLGNHGGTLGVGGTTSKFSVSSLMKPSMLNCTSQAECNTTLGYAIAFASGLTSRGYGSRPVYYIVDFGADPLGILDSKPAIQNAITMAGQVGGEVDLGPGIFLTSAPICVSSSSAYATGGITVQGVGHGRYNGQTGSVIRPTFGAGDVFTSNCGSTIGTLGVTFRDFNIDRLGGLAGATPTSGSSFDVIQSSASGDVEQVYIEDVTTWGDYDSVTWGDVYAPAHLGQLYLSHDFFDDVHHYALHGLSGGWGGLVVADSYMQGDPTIYSGAKTSVWFENDGEQNPLYVHDIDVEGFSNGFYQSNTGSITDYGVFTHVLIDGVNGGPAFKVVSSGGTAPYGISGLTLDDDRMTMNFATATAASTVSLSAGGSPSYYLNGVDDVRIIGGDYGCVNCTSDFFIGDGARDITMTGVNAYASGATGTSVVRLGGTSTTQKIVLTGDRFGDVYTPGGANATQCILIDDGTSGVQVNNVTISGDDLTGCLTNALATVASPSGSIAGLTATGNNMSGYSGGNAVSLAGTITGSRVAGNIGFDPIGNLTAPTVPSAGTFIANPFPEDCDVYVYAVSAVNVYVEGTNGTSAQLATIPVGQTLPFDVPAGASIGYNGSTTNPTWKWFCK